jgi:hypothetical protein
VYKDLASAAKSLDFAQLQTLAYQASDEVSSFNAELQGALWSVAEAVPVYGSDVKAAKKLVAMLDELTTDILLPISDLLAATSLDQIVSSQDGVVTVNLDIVRSLVSILQDATPSIQSAVETVNGIGTLHIDQLKSVVEQAQELLEPLSGKIDKVLNVLGLLPNLLGAENPRTYMLVAQTNCEIRSNGGFPGSLAFVTADNGAVVVGDFSSMYDTAPQFPDSPLDITDEERTLFGDGYSYYIGIMNDNPDFPRTCELWSQACAKMAGKYVDGVVALDPVFLQNVLGLCGTLTLEDGTIMDGSTTAQVLMSDVYWRYVDDNDAQDAFFSVAASSAIDFVLDNIANVNVSQLLNVVKQGIANRRLTAWSAYEDEEELLDEIGCSGALFDDPAEPVVGIYLGDETWAKIDWWLETSLELETVASLGSASNTTHVSYTLMNTIPEGEDWSSNSYVTGYSPARRQSGDMVTHVWIFAPADGQVANFDAYGPSSEGALPGFSEATYKGHQVLTGLVKLLPGEQATLSFDVIPSTQATKPVQCDTTPICRDKE